MLGVVNRGLESRDYAHQGTNVKDKILATAMSRLRRARTYWPNNV